MSIDRRAGDPAPLIICDECGYDLRAAEPGQPCPECGHVQDRSTPRVPVGTVWTISVTAGLALLLLLTIDGVSSVLVQPFEEVTWGGTLPALNLPGPKLWAVPLLQRPIGNSPELPGVVGTRTAMLSVLAIWLITTRKPGANDSDSSDATRDDVPASTHLLRLATRWATIVTFGANFGVLVSQQGFWPSELPPYRVLLVCTAELPATLLLYLYLDRLAGEFAGRAYRRAFDALIWAVPMVIVAGGAMLALSWLSPDTKNLTSQNIANLPVAAVYGIVAMCVGVAASAAVAWLAGAFALRAFPSAWRAMLGTRRWITAVRENNALTSERIRAGAIAAGLVLLTLLMIVGVEQVGWYTSRAGLAGNLPFYNFPGPKIWAAAAVPELASRGWWEPLISRTMLTVLNLVAIWLVTLKLFPDESFVARGLRQTVRWLPVLGIGAALGFASTMGYANDYGESPLSYNLRSEFFAAVTLVVETPTTVLLYAHLGVLAGRCERSRLRICIWTLAPAIIFLTAAGLAGLALSRQFERSVYKETPVLVAGAVFGALALTTAAWAVVSLLSLAETFARRIFATDETAREIPIY